MSFRTVVCCSDFCYSNGWQTCHYGRQCVVMIFITLRDGSLVIMEGCMLSISLLLQWMVAFSLWKVVFVVIFVTLRDCSLVVMEGSLLSISLLLQWMVAQSLWKVVCCRDFCYSNGWYPCRYGRQSVVEFFDTLMDCSFVIMEGSLFSRFLLLQWVVALSLWKVVCCREFFYSIGRQPCHYGRQCVVYIFVIPMDG